MTLRPDLNAVKNRHYATDYSFIKQGNMSQSMLMLQGLAAPELINYIIFCAGKCSSYENSQPCTAH